MKRVLGLVCAALMAFALTGMAVASADDVTADKAPTPESPIVWTGNGTNAGLCGQIFQDGSVQPGEQVWLFILTSPSSSSWALTASFDDGTSVSGLPPTFTAGSIHFEVTTDAGARLLSASATNGQTNSVLTVSHCTANGEGPSPRTGSLSVVKVTTGGENQDLPEFFVAHVVCTNDDDEIDIQQDVNLPSGGGAGDPAVIDNIPAGDFCTVVEDAKGVPSGTEVGYQVDGVASTVVNTTGIEIEGDQHVEVTISNDIPDLPDNPDNPDVPDGGTPEVAGEVVVAPTVVAADPVTVSPAFTG
jgi:hypothetical protein